MTKKVPKRKKTNRPKSRSPFDIGMEAQQTLAESLCDQLNEVEGEDIDEAFIGAFHGLTHRMLTFFNKEFVLGIVDDMNGLVEKDENDSHVCNDCMEKHESTAKISDKDRNKMN